MGIKNAEFMLISILLIPTFKKAPQKLYLKIYADFEYFLFAHFQEHCLKLESTNLKISTKFCIFYTHIDCIAKKNVGDHISTFSQL
jgi:hypothetical protein